MLNQKPLQIVRSLGQGAFGRVYLAKRHGPEGFCQRVAVKELHENLARDPAFLNRFVAEAQIGAMLQHNHVVRLYDFLLREDKYLLLMEFVDGPSLSEILRPRGKPPRALQPGHAAELAIQLCAGLKHVHSRRDMTGRPMNLVHQDLKPSNLLIDREGVLKIADFGVARSMLDTVTHENRIRGTLAYMSPEQSVGKEASPLMDQFAAGLVIAEMILGRPVYQASDMVMLWNEVRNGNVGTVAREVDAKAPGFGGIIHRALQLSPEDRFPHMGVMAEALQQLQARLRPTAPLSDLIGEVMDNASEQGHISLLSTGDLEGQTVFQTTPLESLIQPTPSRGKRAQLAGATNDQVIQEGATHTGARPAFRPARQGRIVRKTGAALASAAMSALCVSVCSVYGTDLQTPSETPTPTAGGLHPDLEIEGQPDDPILCPPTTPLPPTEESTAQTATFPPETAAPTAVRAPEPTQPPLPTPTPEPGGILLRSWPATTELWVDQRAIPSDTPWGFSPVTAKAGRHHIRASTQTHETLTFWVQVDSGETCRITLDYTDPPDSGATLPCERP